MAELQEAQLVAVSAAHQDSSLLNQQVIKEHIMNRQQGFRAKFKSRQQGAVAIIVAICLTLLVAMIGLVVDLGHMFIIKTELQNAADSCALAAAKELDGTAESLERAENTGIIVGQLNNVDLQNEHVSILPSDVTFSETLGPNANYISRANGASSNSRYVMCTLRRSGIVMWFMQVLGFTSQAVGARAVATLQPSQTSCAIPLGICRPTSPATSCTGGGTPDSEGMCVGDWLSGRFDNSDGLTGSFNWIDFTPPGGGASELANILTGAGQCNLTVANQVGQTGVIQSAAIAWNSRFGLYRSGQGNPGLTTAAPDFTGYSYTTTPEGVAAFPQQRDALSDFLVRRSSHAIYQGNLNTGLNINMSQYGSSATVAELTTSGSNRRLVTAPIVNCGGWATSQTVPILNWACVLMLHPIDNTGDMVRMEYRGLSNLSNSPCATFGVPGGTAGPLVPVLVQ